MQRLLTKDQGCITITCIWFCKYFTNKFIQFMVKDSTFPMDIFLHLWQTWVGLNSPSGCSHWEPRQRQPLGNTSDIIAPSLKCALFFIRDKDKELHLILSSFCDSYFSHFHIFNYVHWWNICKVYIKTFYKINLFMLLFK